MAAKIPLKTLNNYYFLILTAFQTSSMALFDTDSIRRERRIGYGLDGYDLCRYLFPSSFFKGKPNPHQNQIRKIWDSFFDKSDGEQTFGIISPFALLEMFSTIEEATSGKNIHHLSSDGKIRELIKDLATGMKALEEVPKDQKALVEKLHQLVSVTEEARKIIATDELFSKLNQLLNSGKIQPLDFITRRVASDNDLLDLLVYDSERLHRGLSYLNNKRKQTYSEYSTFYNTLDIYHYVLFENIDQILDSNKTEVYISSSGILSRNSWFLTKYGKLPDDLVGVQDDWSARSSAVPAALMKALNDFRSDLRQTRDFFEESRSLARVILRDFQEIPEVFECLTSATDRRRLLDDNPMVEIRNRIPQAILRFQNEYLSVLAPESQNAIKLSANDVPFDDIDFSALHEWMVNPKTRSQEFEQVTNQVRKEAKSLNLFPLDWRLYIAPLGDTAYEILKTFDPNLDV